MARFFVSEDERLDFLVTQRLARPSCGSVQKGASVGGTISTKPRHLKHVFRWGFAGDGSPNRRHANDLAVLIDGGK